MSEIPERLPPEVVGAVSPTCAHLYAMVPVHKEGLQLHLAGLQLPEEELRLALAQLTQCEVQVELAAEANVLAALGQYYPRPNVQEVPVVSRTGTPLPGFSAAAAAPAPVLRLCRRLIVLATDPEAASLFLLPRSEGAAFRSVTHAGARSEERWQTTFLAHCVVRQFKAFAGLDVQNAAAQYGTFEVTGMRRDFKLVVETFMAENQECLRVEMID